MTAPPWMTPQASVDMAKTARSDADEIADPNSIAYWKIRAFRAEAKLRQMGTTMSNQSWELENHRQDAQRRRDAEIGQMGGGG